MVALITELSPPQIIAYTKMKRRMSAFLMYKGTRPKRKESRITSIAIFPPLTAIICTSPLSTKVVYCSAGMRDLSPMSRPSKSPAYWFSQKIVAI